MQQIAQAELPTLVTVRPAEGADFNFILPAWSMAAYSHLESFLYLSNHGKKPSWPVWRTLFPDVQANLLQRARAFVVSPNGEPSQILSCAVVEALSDGTPVLHWVSTKKKLWRRGLAEHLLRSLGFDPDAPAVFTFAGSAYKVFKRRIERWDYVPFWLFAPKSQG